MKLKISVLACYTDRVNVNFLHSTSLFVTASRGVGCVFAARKRALVYILEEDEEEEEEEEEEASDMD